MTHKQMRWYQRLRWRLVGVQIFGVLVGALSMLGIWYGLFPARLGEIIGEPLSGLPLSAAETAAVENALFFSVNRLVVSAIGAAVLVAVFAGIASSLILWQIIIRPLRGMLSSSQRIANGRYDERVAIPQNAGEAMAQLAHNFNQMADSLASTENQRVELLGNVTHELRTPLTSLNGYVEGLADGIFEPNERVLNSMGQQIGRLTRLVDDIQLLSKVEAGAIQLDIHPIPVCEIVKQVVFQLRPRQLEKEITINLVEVKRAIYVLGDYDRTVQILVNLVSNGIQYTPNGGAISISCELIAGMCHIIVVDNGAGIPAEALPFLFERFYRVDPSRSRAHGGSGVGLTISRHLAWGMGGELTAASDGVGQGSRFILELPCATN